MSPACVLYPCQLVCLSPWLPIFLSSRLPACLPVTPYLLGLAHDLLLAPLQFSVVDSVL
jgi:hypothetical protein